MHGRSLGRGVDATKGSERLPEVAALGLRLGSLVGRGWRQHSASCGNWPTGWRGKSGKRQVLDVTVEPLNLPVMTPA